MSTTLPQTPRISADEGASPTRPVAIDPAAFRTPTVIHTETAVPPVAGVPVANYRTGIDHIRFWVGTGLAAAISAMTALVGMLLIIGVLQVRLPVTESAYALVCAAVVIGASALYNLMLHVAPHPTTYYGALAAVLVCLAVLVPFTLPFALYSQIAFASLNLVVGLMIAFLVPMAVVAARR